MSLTSIWNFCVYGIKGLFAGVSFAGMMMLENKNANNAFYGREITSEEILLKVSL